jgi:dTDP-4-amino-4,6-dideoxygalactose transaminase
MVLIAPTRSAEIPLVDLTLQHREIAEDVMPRLSRLMAAGGFIGGSEVSNFEAAFAAFCQRLDCVGVGNGTDAVELMLRAGGIGPGDDVVVPANTFVATVAAVVRAGARPVFADCDPLYHLLDPASVRESVTPATRAIMAVHLYGQMAPMPELAAVAEAHGALLFEDAAQAHGATQCGRAPGDWGHAAAFSFYPGKNLGAYGDAGAVATDDAELAVRVRALRNHGGDGRYDHRMIGWNSRLDALQAAVLMAKLPHLRDWNDERAQVAGTYDKLLAGHDAIRRPNVLPGNDHVWHLYVVRVPERDRVLAELNAAGIQAGVHYPVPIHLLPGFKPGGGAPLERFPNAELMAQEILSLPIYPGITAAQTERVAETLLRAVDA